MLRVRVYSVVSLSNHIIYNNSDLEAIIKQCCCIVSSLTDTIRNGMLWTRKLSILLRAIWDNFGTYSNDIPDPP